MALLAHYTANKNALISNDFSLEPLKEVCIIFIGIFGTMIPALEIVNVLSQSELAHRYISPTLLYWSTGACSAVLDNAPTYLNFLTASTASKGANISIIENVYTYAQGTMYQNSWGELRAISLASVFFGAMTYIGNGPNG